MVAVGLQFSVDFPIEAASRTTFCMCYPIIFSLRNSMVELRQRDNSYDP